MDSPHFERRTRTRCGVWSNATPPYLQAIADRDFARLKEEWLSAVMRKALLVHSHRVVGYFLADYLNWCTMDCWVSHETLARVIGSNEKTIQRGIVSLEDQELLSVWRLPKSRMPLRYAPVYLAPSGNRTPRNVALAGHSCPSKPDIGVHESFLTTLPESSLVAGREGGRRGLPFPPRERGRFEQSVSAVLGDDEALHRLALIDDAIVMRLCVAYALGEFGDRQVKATKLAVKQLRLG